MAMPRFTALTLLTIIAALVGVVSARPKGAVLQHVYWHKPSNRWSFGSPVTTELEDMIPASIAVNNSGVNKTGWDAVYVETNPDLMDQHPNEAYFAAGYAEGAATVERIYQEYLNIDIPAQTSTMWSNATHQWIERHLAYMRTNVKAKSGTDNYWAHVGYMLKQVEGIAAGYAAASPPSTMLTFYDIFLINFHFEINDVEVSVNPAYAKTFAATDASKGHCSAMIKVTPDDLFMTHITWFGYHTMLRQYKIYNFSSDRVISFSGYPGTVSSGDDWYMLNNGLTIQETTNLNYNKDNYQFTVAESVSSFIRIMISHRMTDNGADWTKNFCRENSGTYNNQWMVVDQKIFQPGQELSELPKNLLWVAEQMPGMCVRNDTTHVLREKSYWASYNLPYFPAIYNWSGALAKKEELGSYFSYTEYTRPQIFKRDQPNITDLESVKRLMRYNDYKHDPLSLIPNCSGTPGGVCSPAYSASLAIAARADLNPAEGNYGPLGADVNQQSFGALDAKIVRWTEHKEMLGHVVSGPTTGTGLPPFQWSTSPFPEVPHFGQPDLYTFPWTTTDKLWGDGQ